MKAREETDHRSGVETDLASRFGAEYMRLGAETKPALVGLLPEEWSFPGKRILDFGCGAGRTLHYFLPEAGEAEFWGADIDAASIEMVREHLCPPMHALRCEVDPPLGLEYCSFDLAWAISVFTHLTDNSIPWLLELHRLLKPGGLLIATFMGRYQSELVAGEQWDEDRVGMNVLRHNRWGEGGGPMVLMSEWWVRGHWGRAFEVLEIAPEIHSQSWAVLRKRDVELTAEDLERPENDPREYAAARHNLVQLRGEIELLQQKHEARFDDLRREFEESSSWRLTRPLRAARQMADGYRRRLSP